MMTDLLSQPQRRRRLLIWGAELLAVVAAIVAIVVGVRWLAAVQLQAGADNPNISLEAQWNSTIRRLGVDIEPVYPPQEDLSVGDLFATVVGDDKQFPSGGERKRVDDSTPFLGKSVKLGHVDLSKELAATYNEIPVFPETGATRSTGQGAPEVISATGLFEQRGRKALPLAAFPGLTINHTSSAGAGVAAKSRGWFDFSASTEESLKLMLGVVETYGLDVVTASNALSKFCEAPATASICQEETMRKHLRPLVDNVLEKFADPISKIYRYSVTVRLIMVNRVYLAREILEQRKIGATEGGSAQAGRATTSPPAGAPTTADQRIAALEKQLGELQNGGTIVFRAAAGTDMLMDVKFTRPVAIGYRGVPYEKQIK